jgi:hypothetical protein
MVLVYFNFFSCVFCLAKVENDKIVKKQMVIVFKYGIIECFIIVVKV